MWAKLEVGTLPSKNINVALVRLFASCFVGNLVATLVGEVALFQFVEGVVCFSISPSDRQLTTNYSLSQGTSHHSTSCLVLASMPAFREMMHAILASFRYL